MFNFKNFNLSKFLQSRFNVFIFSVLPFRLSQGYIFLLGTLYHLFNRKSNIEIKQSISEAILKPGKFRKYFFGIYHHYHEKLFVGYSNFPKLLDYLRGNVKFTGLKYFYEAINLRKGIILVTAHFGAVELLPGTMALNNWPTSMVVRFKTARLRERMCSRAKAVGLNLIDADHDKVLPSILDVLSQGRILITECDEFEDWKSSSKNKFNFILGKKLPYNKTLDVIQKRSGATVLMTLVIRAGKNKYICSFLPLTKGKGTVMVQCLEILESMVKQFPDQWYQWRKFGALE